MRIAWLYDLDACRDPTGVTRHALAQLERLAARPGWRTSAVYGRVTEPDGLAYAESLRDRYTDRLRLRELPLRTRDMLRAWRLIDWPPVTLWSGPADWVYCPAEFLIPPGGARLAVTSHDALQDVTLGSPRRLAMLHRAFARADLVLSVSQFNTSKLEEYFPAARGKARIVPNGAEDLFFEPATDAERRAVRADLDLPPGLPYLLSVANFQPRKNLARLIRAAGTLPEVARGELALVLLGSGSPDQAQALREAADALGPGAVVKFPGYRQGAPLRAAYAEATALAFPSTCESFGIPAVEAMAQGCPVALANSTALPEIAGEAGWYFDPGDDRSIAGALRDLLDRPDERSRRIEAGRAIASGFRWDAAHALLIGALSGP